METCIPFSFNIVYSRCEEFAVRRKKKNMCVSSDPTDPNFLLRPYSKVFIAFGDKMPLNESYLWAVISGSDIFCSIKYPMIHTCYLFVLFLLLFRCKRSKIGWKKVWSWPKKKIKKRFSRPTDPNIFRHVTGNRHFFFGLSAVAAIVCTLLYSNDPRMIKSDPCLRSENITSF